MILNLCRCPSGGYHQKRWRTPTRVRSSRLSGLDQSTGELDVVGGGYAGKVRGQEPGGSRVSALAADVRKGPGEEEELGAL